MVATLAFPGLLPGSNDDIAMHGGAISKHICRYVISGLTDWQVYNFFAEQLGIGQIFMQLFVSFVLPIPKKPIAVFAVYKGRE